MAIKALNLTRTRKFISKSDTGPDAEKTVWLLGTLSSRDIGRIRDSASSFEIDTSQKGADGKSTSPDKMTTNVERSKMNMEAVRLGLRGWENFLDDDGEPIKFVTKKLDIGGKVREVIPMDVLDIIPADLITELADALLGANTPEETDAGN